MTAFGPRSNAGVASQGGPRWLALFDAALTFALSAVCVGLFVVMLGAVGLQVVMRYAFNAPLVWSEELARFAMIWLVFLAAALAARKRQHIAVTGLFSLQAPAERLLSAGLTVVFLVVVAVVGWQGYLITLRTTIQRSTALQIPMSAIYAAIPTAAALMIVCVLLSLMIDGRGDAPADTDG